MLAKKTKKMLRALYAEQSTQEEFTDWLYQTPGLEKELGEEWFQNLIEIDFRSEDGLGDARAIVEKIYGPGLLLDRALDIALRAVESDLNLIDACHQLGRLHNQGCEEIPIEFVGYSSELSDNEEFLDHYKARIDKDLRSFIRSNIEV